MCAKRKGHMAGNGEKPAMCAKRKHHMAGKEGGTKPNHRMAQGKGDKKAMCARHLAHMAGCKYVQGIKVYSLMLGSSRPRCFLRSTTLR